jgi:hypothetical protein
MARTVSQYCAKQKKKNTYHFCNPVSRNVESDEPPRKQGNTPCDKTETRSVALLDGSPQLY